MVLCFFMFPLALRNMFLYVLHSRRAMAYLSFYLAVCVEYIEHFLLASHIILDNCTMEF